MKIKLDKRLKTIIDLIDCDDTVADIGTDHGKIAVKAFEKTKKQVVATDISEMSISKAKRLAYENDLLEAIDFRIGDGLSVIEKDDADTIIIAGMGGCEIIKILKNAKYKYKKYILVPHQNSVDLRLYLINHGYGIKHDFVVLSGGKFYQIIVIDENSPKRHYTPFELMFGFEKTEDFEIFRKNRIKKLENIKKCAKGENLEKIIKELEFLKNENES